MRPKNLYGASKAFGEALASYFAYQEGLEAIAVRIGAFRYRQDWNKMSARDLSAWASPRDICALFVRCLEADLGRVLDSIPAGLHPAPGDLQVDMRDIGAGMPPGGMIPPKMIADQDEPVGGGGCRHRCN